ncbi:hypothetical protein [Paenibacillus oceani]|nr:hypothetical protein [Paenibacillus oceani]
METNVGQGEGCRLMSVVFSFLSFHLRDEDGMATGRRGVPGGK